ncbi:hypothetical protein BC940DRAFT_336655 [Gongronella butleri]|nr:hypothetical protein BC940DRAFT_336655 [Gongronella butleri]
MVAATPLSNPLLELELSDSVLIRNDIASLEPRDDLPQENPLQARAQCSTPWYVTKCKFLCPCGWYYKTNCERRCYDRARVGCHHKCPSNWPTRCHKC